MDIKKNIETEEELKELLCEAYIGKVSEKIAVEALARNYADPATMLFQAKTKLLEGKYLQGCTLETVQAFISTEKEKGYAIEDLELTTGDYNYHSIGNKLSKAKVLFMTPVLVPETQMVKDVLIRQNEYIKSLMSAAKDLNYAKEVAYLQDEITKLKAHIHWLETKDKGHDLD